MTPSLDRDRDVDGRPHNARSRDRLGRPQPRGTADDVAPPASPAPSTPDEALAMAQRLLDTGFPFHAHEVLEDAWKSAPQPHRQLWKGLAQLAVGVTHAARGNTRGAVSLLERGAAAIAPYADTAPHHIDVPGLLSWVRAGVASMANQPDGPLELSPCRLRRSDADAALSESDAEQIALLERWQTFGGTCEVVDRVGDQVTVSLRRCDGGEEQERIVITTTALSAWLSRSGQLDA